jgi:hypothetical protein
MSQLAVHTTTQRPVHGRRAKSTSMLERLPLTFWPIAAMVCMLPILAVLLVALFT